MLRRDFLVAGVSALFPGPQDNAGSVSLPARSTQGAVLRGRALPGALIRVDGLPAFKSAPDGRFVVGLGRNAPARVAVSISTDAAQSLLIDVAPRTYMSVVIRGTAREALTDDPSSASAPDEAFGAFRGEDLFDGGDPRVNIDQALARASRAVKSSQPQRLSRELAAKRKAWAIDAQSTGFADDFIWPARGRISSRWGRRADSGHAYG